jgi:hypothetical protein
LTRFQNRTVLFIGEGNAEEFFLRHLKSIYVQRGSGVEVKIRNAHGKGAGNVIDVAHRQPYAYSVKAALLDTDTDWTERTQSKARKQKIHVFACTPCIEMVFLTMHKAPVGGLTTAQLKAAFEKKFGTSASDPSVYQTHFNHALIEKAKSHTPHIQEIIELMKNGKLYLT